MQIKPPKNDRNYYWTFHSQRKLFQYGLTPNKIKRIIRYPDRKEEGIAPDTIAVMKRKNKKDPKKGEIWVMYQRQLKVKSEKLARNASHNKAGGLKVRNAEMKNAPVCITMQHIAGGDVKTKESEKHKNPLSPLSEKGETKGNIQFYSGQIKIISAWFYPAETPKGKEIFVPDEVWEELQNEE